MPVSNKIPVLAIDGGGSHCRLALVSSAKNTVVETGSANVFTDLDKAIDTVKSALIDLAFQADMPVEQIYASPAFVGLAGFTPEVHGKQLEAGLSFQNAVYADDRPAALRGAFGPGEGVFAHLGTGSFFGSQFAGEQKLAGGWGVDLGDEASAQWVGRRALAETLKHQDGFHSQSDFFDGLLHQFGGAQGIVQFAREATPNALGTVAPKVTQSAEQGDTVARQIMQSGADFIANGLDKMGWQSGVKICLTGGIGPFYRDFLSEEKRLSVVEAVGSPLDGAIALAQDQIG